MTQDLQEIIRRAQRGDREAFSHLVEAHYAAMFRFACRYCGDRQDAQDVTQQACIKLARSIEQFRFESAFSTWLYRLVINCARDWHKAQRLRRFGERGGERGGEWCGERGSELEDAAARDNAESAVMLRQVIALVEQMGEGFRESLVLVLGEGLTHAEAAAILEVKESTVSWRLHEIRKRLNAGLATERQPGVGV
jgi:RNA polymerase sigma-70 factor (ECF subfamily)